MNRNFPFLEDIYIVLNGKKYDIHNNFNLSRIEYDIPHKSIKVELTNTSAEIIIDLLFNEVNFFKIKERDSGYPDMERESINFIGFLHVDDRSVMDGFSIDDGSLDVDFIIGLQDESSIKIGAKEVKCYLQNE